MNNIKIHNTGSKMKAIRYEDNWTKKDLDDFASCMDESARRTLKKLTEKGFREGLTKAGNFVMWRVVDKEPAYVG